MQTIQGQYNTAKVFTDNIDQATEDQIRELCDQPFVEGSRIRIMPDCHAGAGCVIGTTMTIRDKIVPNLVGVDIGCGMLTVKLPKQKIDCEALDQYIRAQIPSGFSINNNPKADHKAEIDTLRCMRDIPKSSREYNRAIGTLGGGNHFIEVAVDDEDHAYLVIHSGSRNLGLQVANHYQEMAYRYHSGQGADYQAERQDIIDTYKAAGKRKQIQRELKKLGAKYAVDCPYPKALCYVEGRLFEDYIHDMAIMQRYAVYNRETMARRIVEEGLHLDYGQLETFQTIHNYIDMESMTLRKGAVSAKEGERLLIPMNMRDGSLICTGKGNDDWNQSAPHGAGRIMSRAKARHTVDLQEFQKTMEGIYSTSVLKSTLDEAPMVYKPMDEIMKNIEDTVTIDGIIRPIYNFKAS